MSVYSLSRNEAGGECPFGIALAPGQSIRVYSVTCEVDGAGASGSFLLALSVYSPDGVLVSRTAPPVTFAAGDTGVVTFAPFLGKEPEPTPAGEPIIPYVILELDGDYVVWRVTETPGQDPAAITPASLRERRNPERSPDGSMVAYEGVNVSGFTEIRVCNADGTGDTVLDTSATTYMQWPAWKPDGAKIVYTISEVGSNAGGRVYEITPAGTGKTLLHDPAAGYCARRPRYNSDGSLIAFQKTYDGFSGGGPFPDRQLWTMNADGTGAGSIANMVAVAQDQCQFGWANASDVLAYYAAGATRQIRKVNADGTGDTLLGIDSSGVKLQALADRSWTDDDLRVIFTAFEDTGSGLRWQIHEALADGTDENLLYSNEGLFATTHFKTAFVFADRIYFVPTTDDRLRSIADDGTGARTEQLLSTGGVGDLFYSGTGFRFL